MLPAQFKHYPGTYHGFAIRGDKRGKDTRDATIRESQAEVRLCCALRDAHGLLDQPKASALPALNAASTFCVTCTACRLVYSGRNSLVLLSCMVDADSAACSLCSALPSQLCRYDTVRLLA